MSTLTSRLAEWEELARRLESSVGFSVEVQTVRPHTFPAIQRLLNEFARLALEPERVLLSEVYRDGVSFCVVFKSGFALDFSTLEDEACGYTLTVSEVCNLCTIVGHGTAEGLCSVCGAPNPRLRGTAQDCGELGRFFYRPAEENQFTAEAWTTLSTAFLERLTVYGMGPLEALVSAEELCVLTGTLLELLERELSAD